MGHVGWRTLAAVAFVAGAMGAASLLGWLTNNLHRGPVAGGSASSKGPATLSDARERRSHVGGIVIIDSREPSSGEGTAAVPLAMSRRVRITGMVRLANWNADSPRDNRTEAGRAAVSPVRLGLEPDKLWASLRVEVAETGESTHVTPVGSFWIDTEVPATARRVTLRFLSNMLMLQANTRDVRLHLKPGGDPVDLQVDVPMIPALVARPMYHGRVITPADLGDPVVQEEFLRQLSETVGRMTGPPAAGQSDFGAVKESGETGDQQEGYSSRRWALP